MIGEGVCSRATARAAERVGAAVAEAGAVLLNGGRTGVMEAASRGAARAGGTVVGVPVVGLRTWKLAPPEARRVPLVRARTPDNAVRLALRAARRLAGRKARTWLS